MCADKVLGNRDFECYSCFKKCTEPTCKTFECHHSYCVCCLQRLMQTDDTLRCYKCTQHHKLKSDLEKLKKIESEKPSTCSNCGIPPKYSCLECSLYFCKNCIKQHKLIPLLKDHELYVLKENEDGSKDEHFKCSTHSNTVLEFYCQTCKKSACKKCEHVLYCYQDKHDVIEQKTAVDQFNRNATDVIRIVEGIKCILEKSIEFITNDRTEFESYLISGRRDIEVKEKTLVNKVQEKSKELIFILEGMYEEQKKDIDGKLQDIHVILDEVNILMDEVNQLMNKPDKVEILEKLRSVTNTIRENVTDISFHKKKNRPTPTFTPFTQLDSLLNTDGFGKITTVDTMYNVAEFYDEITVTKGETFVLKVTSEAESDVCQLTATLKHSSGKESATNVRSHGNREYAIICSCYLEGHWQMDITSEAGQIKGSPVNVQVEPLGLVQTISRAIDKNKSNLVDVVMDTDRYILVSNFSNDILHLDQSGSFLDIIHVSQDVQVSRMHHLGDGRLLYSDIKGKCVVMCDEKFNKICSFGKEILKFPFGLTVNKETRILYVTDILAHCVFRFNIDNCQKLDSFGSEGSEVGQMKDPYDVTLTKEGYVIVADCLNNRIQMFDANGKFIKILIPCGKEDGQVIKPKCVTTDINEDIIVSSMDKLQLFSINGTLKKRIDKKEDGLHHPNGITLLSTRPKKIAVANMGNNIKIFNY